MPANFSKEGNTALHLDSSYISVGMLLCVVGFFLSNETILFLMECSETEEK